eukprot:g2767.t1
MKWFVQTAFALEFLHRSKVLHRDVKPSNIFLRCDSTIVKLGDLGSSRMLEHTQDMVKTAVGTPFYLSPELARGEEYNAKSDVWALGCVLYEMLGSERPFPAKGLAELVLKIASDKPPKELPFHVCRPGGAIRQLLDAMLCKKSEDRFDISRVLQSSASRDAARSIVKDVKRVAALSEPIASAVHDVVRVCRTRLVDDSDEEKEEEDADGESDPHAVSWMNRVLFDGFDIGSDVERDISRVDLRATVERGTHWVPAEFKFSPHSGGVGTWLTPIAGVKASDRQAKDALARTLSSVVGHLERVMSMPLIGRVVPVVVKTTTFHVLPGGFAVHGWRRSGPRDRGVGACIVAVYDHFGVAGGSLQLSRVKENDDVDIFNARRVDLSPTLLRNGHAIVFGNPDRVWWRFSKIDALPMHKILLANREPGDEASRSSRRVHSSQRLMHGDATPSADLQSLVGMIKYVEFVVFAPVRSSARKTGRVYSQSHRYAVSAYLLLVLGGNKTPSADDVKGVLSAVGVEADADKLTKLLADLKDKNIDEIIESGLGKLSSVPSGGGGGAATSGSSDDAAAEEKEEEEEEEEEEVALGGLVGGGDDDGW